MVEATSDTSSENRPIITILYPDKLHQINGK